MTGTIAISWGPYGGFYISASRASAGVCLGWVAITWVNLELDEVLGLAELAELRSVEILSVRRQQWSAIEEARRWKAEFVHQRERAERANRRFYFTVELLNKITCNTKLDADTEGHITQQEQTP